VVVVVGLVPTTKSIGELVVVEPTVPWQLAVLVAVTANLYVLGAVPAGTLTVNVVVALAVPVTLEDPNVKKPPAGGAGQPGGVTTAADRFTVQLFAFPLNVTVTVYPADPPAKTGLGDWPVAVTVCG